MKRPATVQQRVEQARPRAITALAWLASAIGDVRDEGILELVRLALQDYRLRWPGCPATQTWLFYDGDPTTTKIRVTREGEPRSGRVDVYCLFCRALLVNGAIWQHDYSAQLRSHTTLCALRSLGGIMTPGAPGTYRLEETIGSSASQAPQHERTDEK